MLREPVIRWTYPGHRIRLSVKTTNGPKKTTTTTKIYVRHWRTLKIGVRKGGACLYLTQTEHYFAQAPVVQVAKAVH